MRVRAQQFPLFFLMPVRNNLGEVRQFREKAAAAAAGGNKPFDIKAHWKQRSGQAAVSSDDCSHLLKSAPPAAAHEEQKLKKSFSCLVIIICMRQTGGHFFSTNCRQYVHYGSCPTGWQQFNLTTFILLIVCRETFT